MKPATLDILRAHLLAASLTAVSAQIVVGLTIVVLHVSGQWFGTAPFRLLAIIVIVAGVVVIRECSNAAFQCALQSGHATPEVGQTCIVSIAEDCPRGWLVVLHLRLTGRAFVLAGRACRP
ncbi:hypothetical protein [Paraburkholderia sp. BCC1886]|uniref:hypothetical protein n=1 Tax=Paraburkholderia sp. BCC1886 TaxID=2562670 RepID=UPI001181F8C4|nr:hypothetical protein [Paraburkholderia sp. BCC1886]